LALECVDVINYASAGSGIPIVRRLQLLNTSEEALEALTLRVAVECALVDGIPAEWERAIGALPAGETLVFDDIPLHLDPGLLARLDEAVAAQVVVQVMRGDIALGRWTRPSRLLAHNEFYNELAMAELVAAHIQPNHPAIVPVLQAAGELLQRETGDSSLQGYQSGPERATKIAAAIFEALRVRRIGYINPPASFEDTGQKIRTPEQVLEDRLGTCLDLACTYAACLEQAGLNPVLCLIKGHAYAGVLTDGDIIFRNPSLTVANAAVNLQDTGVLVPVETVSFTEGTNIPFDAAVEVGRSRWQDPDAFRAVVDVRAARRAGVRPLPSRVLRDGQLTVIVQETVVQEVRTAVPSVRPVTMVARADDPAPPRLRQWQASLLDLSLRNPLLQMSTRRTGLSVLVPAGGLGILEDLLMGGHAVTLHAHDGLTELQRAQGARTVADVEAAVRCRMLADERMIHVEASEDALSRRVRALREKARLAEEEGGSNILHLALGSLHWTDPAKGTAVRSPILLMPVRLRSAGRGRPMELCADPVGGTSHNFALLQRLRQSFNLSVPELERLDGDASGVDVERALNGLRAAITAQQLNMRVDDDAAIALFEFGKYRMWKDLDDHWRTFLRNPVVEHLVERPTERFKGPVPLPDPAGLDAEEVFCPIPCDGAQLEAIVAAASGASFVLEGPPGTGKSQTITNMIANALAAGKRVLFVAEKRAALSVVKNRLAAQGLGPFCLDIHGKGADAKSLRNQLTESLDRQTGGDLKAWEEGRAELTQRATRLRAYAAALHVPGPLGLSAWGARQRLLALGDGPEVRPTQGQQDSASVSAALSVLRDLPMRIDAAGPLGAHPWRITADHAVAARLDPPRLRQAVDALGEALRALEGPVRDATTHLHLPALRALVRHLEVSSRLSQAQRHHLATRSSTGDVERVLGPLRALQESLATVRRHFRDSILDAEPARLADRLEAAKAAFIFTRRGRVRVAMSAIEPHLRGPAPGADLASALRHAEACARRTVPVGDAVREALGPFLPAGWSPVAADAVTMAEAAWRARDVVAGQVSTTEATATIETLMSVGGGPRLTAFLEALDAFRDVCGATEASVAALAAEGGVVSALMARMPAWRDDAARGFLGLRRWCAVREALDVLAACGFPTIGEAIEQGRLAPAEVARAVARGVARAALEERLAEPTLAGFDGLMHRHEIQRFNELQSLDASLLRDIIPARLLARRRFKPGETMGEVGELRRNELSRQRGGLSIRALLKRYVRAIGELTPCLLMSPDSVAQFLEPGTLEFDLVIFDEASQVTVPDAIGAIARGRSLVVVGDSRQMPPTAFFGGGSADDEAASPSSEAVTTEVPVDLESILSECIESGLPRLWLSWHYRSQEESLIAFSNARYYDGRLASFPAPVGGGHRAGVHWRKVPNGLFDRGRTRTNELEARAVVDEIRSRLADPVSARQSMGVVTFNAEQAELITGLLEDAAASNPAMDAALRNDDPEHRLFVKNLENVQGDERDVILLTIGFARDASGAFPMNFGPLNRAGGQRRWNVAVTRAKREFVLFSSVEPEEIELSRVGAGAEGVRDLRAYMEMARDGVGRLGDVAELGRQGDDPHCEAIAEALRAAGLHVQTGIGLSSFKVDLALSHRDAPDRQLVAVLLDGPGYSTRRTIQDRETLPITVLEQLMRWPATLRIWLPEWLNDHDRVLREATALVERHHQEALARPSVTASMVRTVESESNAAEGVVESVEDPSDEFETFAEVDLHAALRELFSPSTAADSLDAPAGDLSRTRSVKTRPGRVSLVRAASPAPAAKGGFVQADTKVFQAYPLREGDLGDTAALEAALSGAGQMRLLQAVDDILAAEGPTEVGRLGRLIGRRFGLARVRNDRIASIIACVPKERIRSSVHGDFVWPTDVTPDTWREYRRTPTDADRPLECIPPEEVRNAILHFTERGLSVSEEDLLGALAELFDIQRLTTAVRQRLIAHLESALQAGAILRDEDRYRLPE
jgi:hypothetical protein